MSQGSRLQRIKQIWRREASEAEAIAEGGTPVATPPPGAVSTDDGERETSTNAQTQGASDQPWSGNR